MQNNRPVDFLPTTKRFAIRWSTVTFLNRACVCFKQKQARMQHCQMSQLEILAKHKPAILYRCTQNNIDVSNFYKKFAHFCLRLIFLLQIINQTLSALS